MRFSFQKRANSFSFLIRRQRISQPNKQASYGSYLNKEEGEKLGEKKETISPATDHRHHTLITR
jgi:hypothetical protein